MLSIFLKMKSQLDKIKNEPCNCFNFVVRGSPGWKFAKGSLAQKLEKKKIVKNLN